MDLENRMFELEMILEGLKAKRKQTKDDIGDCELFIRETKKRIEKMKQTNPESWEIAFDENQIQLMQDQIERMLNEIEFYDMKIKEYEEELRGLEKQYNEEQQVKLEMSLARWSD